MKLPLVIAPSNLFALALATLVGAGCTGDQDESCSTPGNACLWAGIGERGFNIENPEAHRLESKLYFPQDLTFGPDGLGYVVDWNNHRIRRVEADDSMTVVIGTDYEGDGPPQMEDLLPLCNAFGASPTTVALNHMTDVEFGPDGKLYLAAWHNNKIRVLDMQTSILTTLAGNGYGFSGDEGPACRALFNQPKGIAIAADGTVYTVDQRNVRIRAITPGPTPTIRTIAGTGTLGDLGDGGLALDAQFGFETGTTPRPSGSLVLADSDRTMYVADSANNRIRRINMETGIVDCIAGKTQAGYSGDGGQALDATFNFPMDIELGPDGRLYVADRENHAVRAIDLQSGLIETVVGTGTKCDTAKQDCADSGPAREIMLNEPYGIAFDASGNLYVADTHNNRILKIAR
ncbi:MAG: hypothetical protein H0T42_33745 [Deltaproteobacteria bacterium]|nr:hypothetical protein [Deltaproteobacteria bacterium]